MQYDKRYIVANIDILIEVGENNVLIPLSDKIKMNFSPFDISQGMEGYSKNPGMSNGLKNILSSFIIQPQKKEKV